MKVSQIAAMARAQGTGSPLLEAANAMRDEQLARMREQIAAKASVIGKALGTPDGLAAFEAIFTTYFLREDVSLTCTTIEQVALHAARRQGQKDVVIHLLNALLIHGGEQPVMTLGGTT